MGKNKFTEIFDSRIKILILPVLVILSYTVYGQDSDQNYVKTTTYKVETENSITTPLAEEAVVEVTYIDGLGRPKQKISHQQSGNGDDLITALKYDGFGRQPKEYLPYERGSASLALDPGDGEANTMNFYTTNAPSHTQYPWSEKLFEESPLNRILKQAAPGDEWYMGTGHEIKFAYETNNATEAHHFSVSLSGSTPTLTYEQKYPEGQLYKTVTKDENWQSGDGNKGTVTQFKDKMGRMVLKRTFDIPIGETKSSTGSITMDTYYIYDTYGNLTFVLPPKLSAQIASNGSFNQTLLGELGYQYQYDHRNRLIAKKIPGKHWEYMVYDALDRLIATGPALSPFGDQAEGWLHTKYDIFNRVAYTLWKQGTVNPSQREALANALPTYISEVRIPGNSSVNNVNFSYSNQVPPTSGYHVLTINYYDDYDYTGAPSTIPTTVGEGDIYVLYNNSIKPKGLPTGSWVRELETAGQTNGISSYSLYDKKARPVRVKSSNATSGFTQTDTNFDFIGNPKYTITQHKKDAQASVLTIKDVFTYTDQSRPLKHTHKIGNGAEQLLSLNEYDALGRLKNKKVGGTDISGAAPLQIVDYKYNVRGWLTDINNIVNLAQPGGGPQDLFAFKINYTTVADDINGAVTPLYNGNISETFWRTSSDNIQRKYGYAYDYQNRLLAAYYQKPTSSVPRTDSYSTNYSYDRNGNILSLERNGEEDGASSVIAIDDLLYSYDTGNKLKKVEDLEVSPAGYNDTHNDSTDDFGYDTYGNLILDRDKNITAVEYNHLNLPTKILFSSGGKIEYFYDATGIKLKKKVTDGTTITTTDYMDGFQYINNILDFFPHAEGYVKAVLASFGGENSYGFRYVFNYTDHLGNIRLKYAQDPSNNNQTTILEEDHYYPYGLKHKGYNTGHKVFKGEDGPIGGIVLTPVNPFLGDSYKYKFGGKEYQTEFDINSYDFGARNYDPALGRWMNIDPLAEAMRRHSPYNYAFDNPVFFVDPDGMTPIPGAGGSGLLVMDTNALGTSDTSTGGFSSSGGSNSGGGSSGSLNFNSVEDAGLDNTGRGVNMSNGAADGMASSGGGPGGGDVINPNNPEVLDEVIITGSKTQYHNDNDLSSNTINLTMDALKRRVKYNSENYTYKYANTEFSAVERTAQTRLNLKGTSAALGKANIALVAILSGVDLYNGYRADGNVIGRNTQLAAGRVIGGLVGAYIGGQLGTLAGSLGLNPVTAAGVGFAGAAVGGYYGAQWGESFVQWVNKE